MVVNGQNWLLSLARELSGGISLLVVRSRPGGRKWRGGTEPDDARPRNGAEDETTRRNTESDGEEADVDPGSRDRRDERAQYATHAAAISGGWLYRTVRPSAGQTQHSSGGDGDCRASAGAVPG